jgi:signal transduction histidine kinase
MTAYFIVAEALTNVARHSGATAAHISVRDPADRSPRTLIVEIRDNGHGGADAARGTGLRGLADRVAGIDGTLTLTSPAGGPTVVRAELPCAS